MTRSSASRTIRPALVPSMVWVALFLGVFGLRVGQAAGPRPGVNAQGNKRSFDERPAPRGRPGPGEAAGSRPVPNSPNSLSRPGVAMTPRRPDAQRHLGEWMEAHRNLSPAQQQSALEAEPGFRQLRPEEQQRMHNLVTRLDSMTPEKRQRTMARTEWMEHLAPQQRQQVRSAMAQLGSLPQDRSYAVGRVFRSLQAMPPGERQSYLNSPQLQGQFNDQERTTLTNLLNVSPLLPPADLGATH